MLTGYRNDRAFDFASLLAFSTLRASILRHQHSLGVQVQHSHGERDAIDVTRECVEHLFHNRFRVVQCSVPGATVGEHPNIPPQGRVGWQGVGIH